MKIKVLYIVILMSFVQNSIAQSAQQDFSKVQIQYHKFDWQKLPTKNFDIFYYKGGKYLSEVAASYSDIEYLRICELLGFYNFNKIKLIIYLNEAQKSQSNINKHYINNPSGGESYYQKDVVEIAYTGTIVEFKKGISKQIAEVVVQQMLYGRGVKEIIRSSHHLKFPEWITKGLPEYLAYGWSVKMDNFMFQNAVKSKLSFLNKLRGEQAKIVGQSVWNYLVEDYGPMSIGNSMLIFRATQEIDLAISSSLDISFPEFIHNWKEFYDEQNSYIEENLKTISEENELINFKKKNNINKIVVSPNGEKIAYLRKNKITVINTENNNTIKKYRHKKSIFSTSESLLKWKTNDELIVIYRSAGEVNLKHNIKKKLGMFHSTKDNLVMKNLTKKKSDMIELGRYDNIQNLNFSKDGSQFVFSASNKGQSDIFVMIPEIKKTYRITNDIFDDADASFINNDQLIFATNRINNSSNYKGKPEDIEDNYDLYLFDFNNNQTPFQQLTSELGNELIPKALNDSTIFYISENSGIRQINVLNTKNLNQTKIVGSQENITTYFISDSDIYAQVNNEIYKVNYNLAYEKSEPFKTKRQFILETRTENASFISDSSRNWVSSLIDTTPLQPFHSKYKIELSTKKVTTAFKIDPLFGSGVVFGTSFTDLFENHRINAKIFALSDFSSSNITLQYENYKGKIDKKISYDRKNIFYNSEAFFVKFGMQSVNFSFGIPVTQNLSLYIDPTLFETSIIDVSPANFSNPVQSIKNGLISTKLVFNNTQELGINQLRGTRFSIAYAANFGLSTRSINPNYNVSNENYQNLNIDIRNYKKILGGITWANRIAYGQSFGNSPKNYLFGGMDNWFFPRLELNEIPDNNRFIATNIFQTTYVTNMRGFGYNIRNGNSFLMYNTELRIPFETIFGTSNIGSELLSNLQLNIFSDFGTAWTGPNPLNEDNSFNINTIDNGNSFKIVVKNYRNPVVMGYGFGLRTFIFGTYLKADLGFGVEDFQGTQPTLMISMGHDF